MNESELNELKAKAFAKMAELKAGRDVADAAMRKLAHELPALTMKEVCPDGCNIVDRTIRNHIAEVMGRFNRIDTSLLDLEDIDKWELLTGSDRYEVQEVLDDDGYTMYNIWDGDAQEVIDTEYEENRAERECERLNLEHKQENLYGFPFAYTLGWEISRYDVERFENAGFVVWLYDQSEYIAGIDGGGYSFEGAHFIRVYWDIMRGDVVATDDGYRVLG